MKKIFFVLFIFFGTVSIAQPLRYHLLGGFANYNGDLQEKPFTLQQAKGAIGVGASYTITDHVSVRSDFTYAKVGADDKRNSKPELIARNLNFTSDIYELALLGEYNFLSLSAHKFSPYLFGGVGFYHYNPYTFDLRGTKYFLSNYSTEGQGFLPDKKEYKKLDFNIPVGGGIKYALSEDVHVGFELGLRILRTDYLDDVSDVYVDRSLLLAQRGQTAVDLAFRGNELKNNPTQYPPGGSMRGNPKVKDSYYFGLFKLDFRIGWFDHSSPRGRFKPRKMLDCPPRL
jgi:hypothetical protein